MVALALFATGRAAGRLAQRVRAVAQIRDVRSLVEAHGGHFYYDFQLTDDDRLVDFDASDAPMHWIVRATGIDPGWMHDIVYVTFAQFDHFVKDGGVPARREEITDAVIEPVTRLPQLRWIALSGTAITDTSVERLSKDRRLERIWLSRTGITDRSLELLAQLPGLTHLAIEGTATTDRGLGHVARMRQLRFLSLGSPLYTTTGLKRLAALEGIGELYLDGLPVDDEVCELLGGLLQLRVLSLRGTPMTDRGLLALQRLANLRDVRLDGTRITDRGLEAASGWPLLERISLAGTPITDRGLRSLEPCRKLKSIEIRGTRISLGGLHHLLVELQNRTWPESLAIATGARLDEAGRVLSLDLSGIRVRDEDLPLLAGLDRLQWLKMPRSEITAAGLVRLPELGLKELRLLDVSGCDVDERALATLLEGMPHLRDLHLENVPIAFDALDRMRRTRPSLRIYASQ